SFRGTLRRGRNFRPEPGFSPVVEKKSPETAARDTRGGSPAPVSVPAEPPKVANDSKLRDLSCHERKFKYETENCEMFSGLFVSTICTSRSGSTYGSGRSSTVCTRL